MSPGGCFSISKGRPRNAQLGLETVIVGQALAEGLTMLRAFVPEAITRDLFEAAFGLLLVDPQPNRIEEAPLAAE